MGVMGEAAELTEDERRTVLACIGEAAASLPVVVGVSGESAELVAARAHDAARSGMRALMVSPSRTLGLAEAVAAAAGAGLPIIVQDYPAGSGVSLTAAQIGRGGRRPARRRRGQGGGAADERVRSRPCGRRNPGLGLLGGLGGLFLRRRAAGRRERRDDRIRAAGATRLDRPDVARSIPPRRSASGSASCR